MKDPKTVTVFLTRLLAVFLLVLSFADHEDRIFIGKDYQSAAVEALEFDDIDFPTSVSRSDSQPYSKVERAVILPLALIFNLEITKEIPKVSFPIQHIGIHLPLQVLLDRIACPNAP
ncbi:hypothetical protein KI659_07675 [Litoribacter alkaliphilus]|uniref:Uncharacterized protein n=1 Tax=Litoribacter ruber TaxID=702568 RepID=A0AAP2CFX9_9BACT|nr:hypothetical protein [Litoribacter alkaliphilus]MBS9523891.1 hypothetical protein [Litoribacter alkaliphilus]